MSPALQKKIAGLPAWAWLVGAAVAIGFGLYLRRKSVASRDAGVLASSSGPTGLGDLANSLAGGTTADTPSGLDPATADLLANAQNALIQQSQLLADASYGSAYGSYYDTFGDSSGTGFSAPATVNVAASGVGTVGPGTSGAPPYPVAQPDAIKQYFYSQQAVTHPLGVVGLARTPAASGGGATHPLGITAS